MTNLVPCCSVCRARRERMNCSPEEYYKDRSIASRYDRDRFSTVFGRVFNTLKWRIVLERARLRELRRYRLFPLLSEAVYTVAAKCETEE